MDLLTHISQGSPRLPGRVGKPNGRGSAIVSSDLPLPTVDGVLVREFLAKKSDLNGCTEGSGVSFVWKRPGHWGLKPDGKPGMPEATSVRLADASERQELKAHLERCARLFDEFGAHLVQHKDPSALFSELEQLIADPAEAISAAAEIFLAARQLVQSEAELHRKIVAARSELETLEQQRAGLEELRDQVHELQADLAPVRKFAAAIGVSLALKAAPVPPAVTTPTLDELDRLLGTVATPMVRRASITAALTSLVNGRLLLLDGQVGTGKSSLAERLAGILGGSSAVIPVRPTWIEPADLIGYYDSFSRVFRPGPLLDHLSTALTDRAFVVILDELNLARIENYGSDLLSRLERATQSHDSGIDDEGIPAWSISEYRALGSELEILQDGGPLTPEQTHRLRQLEQTLQFPPTAMLPSGLLIVGTLNTDETTYDLSPKVIDRAFAIPFPQANMVAPAAREEASTQAVSISSFRAAIRHRRTQGDGATEWNQLTALCPPETMSMIGIPLSHRVRQDFETFVAVCAELSAHDNEILPMFLLTRILPRVRFIKTTDRVSLAGAFLAELRVTMATGLDPAWDVVVNRLSGQLDGDDMGVVRYWRSDTR